MNWTAEDERRARCYASTTYVELVEKVIDARPKAQVINFADYKRSLTNQTRKQ